MRAIFDALIHREAGRAAVEGGEFAGPPSENGHAPRFQDLQRARQIEDGLCACTDDDQRRRSQHGQVGGDVFRVPAMHATDAARGEDTNPRAVRQQRRRRDRSAAMHAARASQRQIAHAHLDRRLIGGQRLDLGIAQPRRRSSTPDADHCRHRTLCTNHVGHPPGDVEVGRIGKAVRDQRGF